MTTREQIKKWDDAVNAAQDEILAARKRLDECDQVLRWAFRCHAPWLEDADIEKLTDAAAAADDAVTATGKVADMLSRTAEEIHEAMAAVRYCRDCGKMEQYCGCPDWDSIRKEEKLIQEAEER